MSVIVVKAEISEAVALVEKLGGSSKVFISKSLRAVGRKGTTAVKRGYSKILGRRTGLLFKKISSSLGRDKLSVSVYSRAKKRGVRYGFVLAAGSTKRGIEPRDWFEPEVERFVHSSDFISTVQKVVDAEVGRLLKK